MCLVSCAKEDEIYRSWEHGGDAPAFKDNSTKETTTEKKQSYTKRVALTLDDGPHDVNTRRVVDALAKYGYNATFFVVGNRIDGTAYNGASAMKYAASKGNEIAIHGYTHEVYYDKCTDKEFESELSLTADAIKEVLPKQNVKLMRPIGGRITDARVSSCDYSVIMWSVDSEDWKHKNGSVDVIVENVMSQLEDGDIILMHDIYSNTAEAVEIILSRLNAEGYDVVTVSELLGKNMSAGKKYSCG